MDRNSPIRYALPLRFRVTGQTQSRSRRCQTQVVTLVYAFAHIHHAFGKGCLGTRLQDRKPETLLQPTKLLGSNKGGQDDGQAPQRNRLIDRNSELEAESDGFLRFEEWIHWLQNRRLQMVANAIQRAVEKPIVKQCIDPPRDVPEVCPPQR